MGNVNGLKMHWLFGLMLPPHRGGAILAEYMRLAPQGVLLDMTITFGERRMLAGIRADLREWFAQ